MQQAVDPWKDYWWIVPRYERWIESLELAKHGVKNQMPPELYTDPDFKWRPPSDDEGVRRARETDRGPRPGLAKPPGASIDSRTERSGARGRGPGSSIRPQLAHSPSIPGLEVIGCSL